MCAGAHHANLIEDYYVGLGRHAKRSADSRDNAASQRMKAILGRVRHEPVRPMALSTETHRTRRERTMASTGGPAASRRENRKPQQPDSRRSG